MLLPKTREGLLDRYLRTKAVAVMTLHPNQYAYHTGKSMEMALHQLIVWAKKAINQQETAVGVILDTEGTFNYITFDSMCDARQT
jgi:hypothetical protein